MAELERARGAAPASTNERAKQEPAFKASPFVTVGDGGVWKLREAG